MPPCTCVTPIATGLPPVHHSSDLHFWEADEVAESVVCSFSFLNVSSQYFQCANL